MDPAAPLDVSPGRTPPCRLLACTPCQCQPQIIDDTLLLEGEIEREGVRLSRKLDIFEVVDNFMTLATIRLPGCDIDLSRRFLNCNPRATLGILGNQLHFLHGLKPPFAPIREVLR